MIAVISVLLFFIVVYFIINSTIRGKKEKYGIPKKIRNTYKKIIVSTNNIIILSREYYEEQSGNITASGYFPLNNDPGNIQSNLKYISILTYDDFFITEKNIPSKVFQ
jgi:hypothetical protein